MVCILGSCFIGYLSISSWVPSLFNPSATGHNNIIHVSWVRLDRDWVRAHVAPHLELEKQLLCFSIHLSTKLIQVNNIHLIDWCCVVHGNPGLFSIVSHPDPNVFSTTLHIGIGVFCVASTPYVERHLEPDSIQVQLSNFF